MKKLSKKQKEMNQLKTILLELRITKKYLLSPEVVVGYKVNGEPYGDSYVNKQNEGISLVGKYTGSDLCYLYNAIEKLEDIVNPPSIKVNNEVDN